MNTASNFNVFSSEFVDLRQTEGGTISGSIYDVTTFTDDDKVVWYGKENDHPEKMTKIQEKSLQHSNIISVASKIIAGEISFKIKGKEDAPSSAEEQLINQVKEFYQKAKIFTAHPHIAYTLYAYGGCPILLNWVLKAEAGKPRDFHIAPRPFEEFRLGRHYNTFFGLKPKHHFYSYFWNKIRSPRLDNVTIKNPRSFFATKKLREDWVMKVPAIDTDIFTPSETTSGVYSYLIGLPKKTNKYYPKPFWENGVFWEKANGEYELAYLNRNSIKRGLHSDYMVNIYRTAYNDPTGDKTVEDQKRTDRVAVEKQLFGIGNVGTVKINYIGYQNGDINDAKISEGHMEIIPIPSNNNYQELASRKTDINEDIRSSHAFAVAPMAGLSLEKTAFSNMADYILYLSEMYVENVIKIHSDRIDLFYNEVVNKYNGHEQIETYTRLTIPILRALIKSFKDDLTMNERREMVFGLEPLEDDQVKKVQNIDEKNLAKTLYSILERNKEAA